VVSIIDSITLKELQVFYVLIWKAQALKIEGSKYQGVG